MPKGNERTLGEALQELIHAYGMKGKVLETRLIGHWEEIVGTTIAKRTKDVKYHNKVLTVYVNSPALKNELVYAKDQLASLINEHFGQQVVKEVVIR